MISNIFNLLRHQPFIRYIRTVSNIRKDMPLLRVAVIGAGAGGLCAMRHLLAKPDLYQSVCFEQSTQVGGTWVYTDNICRDEYGLPVHSSMYKNLKTNLPKEIMAFPDFPFNDNLSSFVTHGDVLRYLQEYSDHYNVTEHIQFQTVVNRVCPVLSENKPVQWEVSYSNVLRQATSTTDLFDAVIVCNGHYSVPLLPDIPGLDSFKGCILHSHEYRQPDEFKGQIVACLGARSSGMDIMVELCSVAERVYLCHRSPLISSKLPPNAVQTKGIANFTEDSVVFDDGRTERVDSVIFCTGYRYNFPFLTPECNVRIEDERVSPIYKHLINTQFPSLTFIGIAKTILPFPQFHLQVLVVLSVLDGTLKLPSQADMDAEIERDFQQRKQLGGPIRHSHHMGPKQWAYNDELADLADAPRLLSRIEEIYNEVHNWRSVDVTAYKKRNVQLVPPDSYRIVK